MAAAFVASASVGAAQAATVSSLSITTPAGAAAGQVALLCVQIDETANTLTVPSGWTSLSGPDNNATATSSRLLTRTLTSGDPGSSVSLSLSAASHAVATMSVFSGVTETGATSAFAAETVATKFPAVPTLSSVPANAMVVCVLARRRASTTFTVQAPVEFTFALNVKTNYVSTDRNLSQSMAYLVDSGSGGSYGGDTGSTTEGVSNIGNAYVVSLPATGGAAAVPRELLMTPRNQAIIRSSAW